MSSELHYRTLLRLLSWLGHKYSSIRVGSEEFEDEGYNYTVILTYQIQRDQIQGKIFHLWGGRIYW